MVVEETITADDLARAIACVKTILGGWLPRDLPPPTLELYNYVVYELSGPNSLGSGGRRYSANCQLSKDQGHPGDCSLNKSSADIWMTL